MAENFIDDVVKTASVFAKHRGSEEVAIKDVEFCLKKEYYMVKLPPAQQQVHKKMYAMVDRQLPVKNRIRLRKALHKKK